MKIGIILFFLCFFGCQDQPNNSKNKEKLILRNFFRNTDSLDFVIKKSLVESIRQRQSINEKNDFIVDSELMNLKVNNFLKQLDLICGQYTYSRRMKLMEGKQLPEYNFKIAYFVFNTIIGEVIETNDDLIFGERKDFKNFFLNKEKYIINDLELESKIINKEKLFIIKIDESGAESILFYALVL